DLDAGDVRDGIAWPWRAFQRHAEVAGAGLGGAVGGPLSAGGQNALGCRLSAVGQRAGGSGLGLRSLGTVGRDGDGEQQRTDWLAHTEAPGSAGRKVGVRPDLGKVRGYPPPPSTSRIIDLRVVFHTYHTSCGAWVDHHKQRTEGEPEMMLQGGGGVKDLITCT